MQTPTLPRLDEHRASLAPAYRVYFTHDGETSSATSMTLGAAEAVVRAFEVQHAGDKEAYAEIRELDGSVFGTRVYSFWGGARVGPKDTRHPMEKLFRKAVRSGARVTLIDETGCWQINAEPRMRRAA